MAPERMAAVLLAFNQLCYFVTFFALFVSYLVHNVAATIPAIVILLLLFNYLLFFNLILFAGYFLKTALLVKGLQVSILL